MHRSLYVQEALLRTIHSTLCSDAAAVGRNGSHPSFGRGANVTINCNCLFVCLLAVGSPAVPARQDLPGRSADDERRRIERRDAREGLACTCSRT